MQLNELQGGDFAALSRMVLAAIEMLVSQAHLVHGDLSPYNIVVWDRKPFIIDVSQAPASIFLRGDTNQC